MNGRIRRPMLVLTCALLVGGGLGASGAQAAAPAGGVTIEVGAQAQLRALVLVTVPVRIACPAGFDRFEGDSGPIEQASGQAIAHANLIVFPPDEPLVCDGRAHQNAFTAMADPSGPPFHTGEAALRMSLRLCNVNFECETGGTGFVVIQLRVTS